MLVIREANVNDALQLKSFTDRVIGAGYYSVEELESKIQQSTVEGRCTSFLLTDGKEILGLRLTFPPKAWSKGKGEQLSPHLWNVSPDNMAYFQSLFLDPSLTGQGWGAKLSQASIESLRKLGAKGIVCHSWKESPHNSSSRYLQKLGFKTVAEHPLYWKNVDYVCTRCGKPCLCTAEEMVLYL